MKRINILSFDTETLGLDDPFDSINQIIEFAIVPATIVIDDDGGVELIIHPETFEFKLACPTYEQLEPKLTEWVKNHNKSLIEDANLNGFPEDVFRTLLDAYLVDIKEKLFDGGDLLFLGKSMQSLDAPLIHKHLGWDFIQKWGINRYKVDVQDIARFLIQQGKLPLKSSSSRALVEFFGIKEDVNHTAVEDSIDMLKIYTELLKY